MSRISRTVVRVIISLLVCVAVVDGRKPAQRSSTVDRSLDRAIAGVEADAATSTQLFLTVLGAADSPGGIIKVRDCGGDPTVKLSLSGSSFRNALDAIARADSRYMWSESDSVVNLLPKTGYPPLLLVQITTFEIDPLKPTSLLIQELFSSNEVRGRMSQLDLHEGTYFGTMMTGGKPVSENASPQPTVVAGASLYSVLNQIVRLRGQAVWYYEESHCGGTAEFRVRVVRN